MVFSLSSSSTVSMTTEMTHTLSLSLSVSIYIYVCVCVCVCVHIYIYIKAANVVHALLLQTSRISDRDQLKAPPPPFVAASVSGLFASSYDVPNHNGYENFA